MQDFKFFGINRIKRFIMKKLLIAFLAIFSCLSLKAQMIPTGEEIQEAPKKLHSPAFYAATSIVPGLGQFLLGEPVKGAAIVLTHVGSIAAVSGGFYLAATNPSMRPGYTGSVTDVFRTALEGLLIYGGTYLWIASGVFSVTDAYYTAKIKSLELSVQPTLAYNPCAGEDSYAPGVGIAVRF